jgi:hypothetical protein
VRCLLVVPIIMLAMSRDRQYCFRGILFVCLFQLSLKLQFASLLNFEAGRNMQYRKMTGSMEGTRSTVKNVRGETQQNLQHVIIDCSIVRTETITDTRTVGGPCNS